MPSTAGRGVTVAAVTAAVVATSATALAAAGSIHLSHRNSQADLRTTVLGVGRQIAVDFAAYDYRHIDADFSRVASESTGQFRQQFVTQSAGVRELIIKAKAVSTAEVASEGVVDVAPTTATVVLALDRTVRNTGAPKGQQDSFGLQIDLVRQHGRWLASKVTPL